ncbi:NADH-quinone oxidoreductase subunit N [bacterium]|nr:NADH-quinone oxidoreductase subunit N [bacterium]
MIAIPQIDYSLLLPHILLAAAAILVILFDLLLPIDKKSLNQPVSLILLVLAWFFSVRALIPNPGTSAMLHGDGFSVFFFSVFIIAAILVILTADAYLKRNNMNTGEFYALVIFAAAGASLMAAAADLIVLFLGLEVMSISLYVLAGFHRERLKSNEAALKYFLLGAFFSGFLLYGIVLLYSVAGTTNISALLDYSASPSVPMLIGAALVLIAFGFKASLVPLHFWSPDVYDGAPTPVSAFMATAAKAAAFAAMLRVFYYLLPDLGINLSSALWVIAVLSMTAGNVIALMQSNIKRMLAYSSIAHAGYLLTGFLALNEAGVAGIMFYLFAYTLMNIGAFTIASVINVRGKGDYQISDFAGAGTKNPFLAVMMAVFLFSLAGIPPTAGFFGKFYLFSAALDAGYIYLVVIAVLNSALSVFYYLRVLVIMFMQADEELPAVKWSPTISLALILCALGILNFGIFPGSLLRFIGQAGL